MTNAYVITGPTSGYGRRTAFELAKHGTVVLVGRDRAKLDALKRAIEPAVTVECDLSDLQSVARAAARILALDVSIVGLVNNAGVQQLRPTKNARGWDLSFATNHLGPFALTEALVPHLPDGATVVFLCSAVEDPERKPARMAGFRGGRYVSAEASARGEWSPGGAANAGFDAYATSKQCNLAATLAFARTTPRLRFIAVEPGFSAGTGLGREANVFLRVVAKGVFPLLAPLIEGATNPCRAGRVISNAVLNERGETGVYVNERGRAMRGSPQAHDPVFQDRVVAETRAFLSKANTAASAP
jgi:NAD(P)-dependent dehydrogenase (short-subunit alcohol dehydrogenase family)